MLAGLRARLDAFTPEFLGFDAGSRKIQTVQVHEEDWAENWKKYYKPFRVGRHLVVRPVWEDYEAQPGDHVISIDPGMAFGNGTHETTAMCLGLVEDLIHPGDEVLDVGTGSGILAIASVLMGAKRALGIDIDPVAVRVAQENIARNGLERARYGRRRAICSRAWTCARMSSLPTSSPMRSFCCARPFGPI